MTRSTRFIGDVQGQYRRYAKIIAGAPPNIQLGDLGVDVHPGRPPERQCDSCLPNDAMTRGGHRFIRGNHDDPDARRAHPQWIADGHFDNGLMFVGGALGADRTSRGEGDDRRPDAELSMAELKRMVALYIERRPRIMVTHDCPEEVAAIVQSRIALLGSAGRDNPSRTRRAFQDMWSAHCPELWIFGHHHVSFDHVLHGGREAGTRFVCLAELEYRDISL